MMLFSSSTPASSILFLFLGLAHIVFGEFISTDYDAYNAGDLGHRPYHSFYSSPEHAPVLQANVWNESDISKEGSHIFLRNDGQNGSSLSSPLIIDANDLTTVFMNRSFENIFDVRVQENLGKKYLTFWEGRRGDGISDGYGLAYDENYRLAYKVSAKGLRVRADLHEFAFTGNGTALLLAVDHRKVDTSRWPGWRYGKKFWVLDEVFQEVDLETNEVLFSWRLMDHIDPMDSFERVAHDWDTYHMNSIQKTQDGNYLISIRHLHSIYLINGKTGDIMWTLGGKRNIFKELPSPDGYDEPLAPLLTMGWQHHARWVPNTNETEMTFFDNHHKITTHGECRPGQCSRGLHIRIDDTVSPPTAQILREWFHPSQLQAQSQGSVQPLSVTEDGSFDRVFIGWGRCPTFTEHDAVTGEAVMDVQFSPWHSEEIPDALDNYRAYKQDWVGKPWWTPSVVLREGELGEEGELEVYVSWNGATEVRNWTVKGLVGRDEIDVRKGEQSLEILASSRRTGFETRMTVNRTALQYLWAEALDGQGNILGSTETLNLVSGNVTILPFGMDDGHWKEGEELETTSPVVTWSLVGGGAVVGLCLVLIGGRVLWQRYREYDALDADDFDEDVGSDMDMQSVAEFDFMRADMAPEPWQDYSPLVGSRIKQENDALDDGDTSDSD